MVTCSLYLYLESVAHNELFERHPKKAFPQLVENVRHDVVMTTSTLPTGALVQSDTI